LAVLSLPAACGADPSADAGTDGGASVARAPNGSAPSAPDLRTPPAAGDTRHFDERVVVFVEADAVELERARAGESAEDWATIADDLMWYRAEAREELRRRGLPVVTLEGREPLAFVVGGRTRVVRLDTIPWLDVLVLYEPGKEPRAVATVDLSADASLLSGYFGLEAPGGGGA
jgi:hypothetical protein